MRLKLWVNEKIQAVKDGGGHTTRRKILEALAKEAGISYGTLAPVDRNGCLVMYDKALAVSQATGFQVTVIELCDPNPETRLAQILAQLTPAPSQEHVQ